MRLIRLIYPGKTKEGFIKEGVERYIRFLRPYARVELVEVKPGRGSKEEVIRRESEELLREVKSPFFLLDREGRQLSSEEFAGVIKDRSEVVFIIGGAYGVSEEVRKASALMISLSKMTFTHELSRLLLMEQLYRAMTIIHGKRYHY